MGFPRRERWSELPFPPAGDLATQGWNQGLDWQVLISATWEVHGPDVG